MKKSIMSFIAAVTCSLSLVLSAAAEPAISNGASADNTQEVRVIPEEEKEELLFKSEENEVSKASKVSLSTPNVTIQNTNQGVKLSWNKISNAKGYKIYRAIPGDKYYTLINTTFSRTILSYTDTKAKSGQPYYYCVRAYTRKGKKTIYSGYKDHLHIYLARPGKPSLANTDQGVKVSWNAVDGAASYDIYRWAGQETHPVKVKSVLSLTHTIYDDTVEEGGTYEYAIVARATYLKVTYSSYLLVLTSSITFNAPDNNGNGSGSGSGDSSSQNNKTIYRAFLVGEYKYNNPKNNLKGPYYDVNIMKNSLMNMQYKVVSSYNLSKAQIISQIKSAFADADDNDVSLFFYSGHGCTTGKAAGSLYCSDESCLTPEELAQVCKSIPGKVIIMLDSCGSGEGIAEKSIGKAGAKKFNQMVCEAFEAADEVNTEKSGEFIVSNKFYVLTGCAARTVSYEASNSKYSYGYFTKGIVEGIGYSYDQPSQWSGKLPADQNGDSAITLKEAYAYCYNVVNTISKGKQAVQIYPKYSKQVIYNR